MKTITGTGNIQENSDIKIWNRKTDVVLRLQGHVDTVDSIAFSPDSKQLVSGSDDWTIRLWDVPNVEKEIMH